MIWIKIGRLTAFQHAFVLKRQAICSQQSKHINYKTPFQHCTTPLKVLSSLQCCKNLIVSCVTKLTAWDRLTITFSFHNNQFVQNKYW